jgi:uncharacterized membrane protein
VRDSRHIGRGDRQAHILSTGSARERPACARGGRPNLEVHEERAMSDQTPVFLTIHIITAIVAFGPSFAFPLMAQMAAREPQNGLFVLRLTERIQRSIMIPAALTMPISGGLLVWSEGIELSSAHWLVLAIVLYLVAMTYAIVVQLRAVGRMIELGSQLAAMRPSMSGGPGAALADPVAMLAEKAESPAAEMVRLGARVRNGGIFLALMVVVIVSLMAGKPAI